MAEILGSKESLSNQPSLLVEQSMSPNGWTGEPEAMAMVYFLPPNNEAARTQGGSETTKTNRILIARISKHNVYLYPINGFSGSAGYLEYRYGEGSTIVVDRDDYVDEIPGSEAEVTGVLMSLPEGFYSDWQLGLGFTKPAHQIVSQIFAKGPVDVVWFRRGNLSHLMYFDAGADGPTFFLGIRKFRSMQTALKSITAKKRADALHERRMLIHNELLVPAAPDYFELQSPPVSPNSLFKLVTLGRERAQFTRKDRSAAVELVKEKVEEIAHEDSQSLLSLKSDIERVTLKALVERMREMLRKNLTEASWQRFFADNPFVLSLAFSYPVFLLKDSAHVGGTQIKGGGERISDFLVAQHFTGVMGVIEIKRPATPLVRGKVYRNVVSAPHEELSGAVLQVLDQKAVLAENFLTKARAADWGKEIQPYVIQCVVIAGTMPVEPDKKRSFELFRQSSRDVVVITYDELLLRLQNIYDVLSDVTGAEASEAGVSKDAAGRLTISADRK